MLFRFECHIDQRHWVCAFPGVSLPTLLPTIAHVSTSATDGYALTVSPRPQSSSSPERVKSFEALDLLSEKFPIKKCFRLIYSSSKQRLATHIPQPSPSPNTHEPSQKQQNSINSSKSRTLTIKRNLQLQQTNKKQPQSFACLGFFVCKQLLTASGNSLV